MATWHPPIPAGKLYSGPAIKLGSALAMLIWCYDGIQRDGTIEVQLEQVQHELGVSYRTIKDWWRLLKSGPFFCEQIDRGRRGWVVRMADDWIDWHVMNNNYPRQGQSSAPQEQVSRTDEGQESALEERQGPVKAPSRPDEGRNSALENSAYKVLHDDQNPERVGGKSKHALSPAVCLYFEFYPGETLSARQIAEIDRRITDLKRFRRALEYWTANRHRAQSIGKICDRHDEEATGPPGATGTPGKNGHRMAESRPALQPFISPTPPDTKPTGESIKAILEARKQKP